MIEDLNKPTPIIRKALSDMEFSRHVTYDPNKEEREMWIQSEIYQVLRIGFNSTGNINYRVTLESAYHGGRADIRIFNGGRDKMYVIEVKRAVQNDTLYDLPKQLRKAKDMLKPTRTFAFILDEEGVYDSEDETYLNDLRDSLIDQGLIERKEDIFIKGPESINDY
jgi:hypothetical protein